MIINSISSKLKLITDIVKGGNSIITRNMIEVTIQTYAKKLPSPLEWQEIENYHNSECRGNVSCRLQLIPCHNHYVAPSLS